MKIIMSPSKTQASAPPPVHEKTRPLLWPEKTDQLFTDLGKVSKKTLQETLNIKGKILDKTYQTYQAHQASSGQAPVFRALDLYQGAVFSQLDWAHYGPEEKGYLEDHLCILSAIYGLVEPAMGVYPYRLDMQSRPQGLNLYAYWQAEIDRYFSKVEVIVNLASQEYAKMLGPRNQEKVYQVRFLEEQADQTKKTAGVYAKKARGQMIDLMVKNKVIDHAAICHLDLAGYKLDPQLTDQGQCSFVRPYQP